MNVVTTLKEKPVTTPPCGRCDYNVMSCHVTKNCTNETRSSETCFETCLIFTVSAYFHHAPTMNRVAGIDYQF